MPLKQQPNNIDDTVCDFYCCSRTECIHTIVRTVFFNGSYTYNELIWNCICFGGEVASNLILWLPWNQTNSRQRMWSWFSTYDTSCGDTPCSHANRKLETKVYLQRRKEVFISKCCMIATPLWKQNNQNNQWIKLILDEALVLIRLFGVWNGWWQKHWIYFWNLVWNLEFDKAP